MLNKKVLFNDVVLVGSTSDIGISIINKIPLYDKANIHLVGRRMPEKNIFQNPNLNLVFHKCELSDITEVTNLLTNSSDFKRTELVILAAGYLPEENSEFDLTSLGKTFQINSISSIICLSGFAKIMNENRGGKILVCSSVASIRPRLRNFSYGASKSALDFYAIGLQSKLSKSKVKISILRPGYVFTKMTENFKPAPFSITSETLARISVDGLFKNKKVIYVPWKLKIIMNLLRIVPRFMFNKLG
jgi:short-subunit dehydrogenase